MAAITDTAVPTAVVNLQQRLKALDEEFGIEVAEVRQQLEIALSQLSDGDVAGAIQTSYQAFALTFEPQMVVIRGEREEAQALLRSYWTQDNPTILTAKTLLLMANELLIQEKPALINAHRLVRQAFGVLREVENVVQELKAELAIVYGDSLADEKIHLLIEGAFAAIRAQNIEFARENLAKVKRRLEGLANLRGSEPDSQPTTIRGKRRSRNQIERAARNRELAKSGGAGTKLERK
jgi:hypothetical protein